MFSSGVRAQGVPHICKTSTHMIIFIIKNNVKHRICLFYKKNNTVVIFAVIWDYFVKGDYQKYLAMHTYKRRKSVHRKSILFLEKSLSCFK